MLFWNTFLTGFFWAAVFVVVACRYKKIKYEDVLNSSFKLDTYLKKYRASARTKCHYNSRIKFRKIARACSRREYRVIETNRPSIKTSSNYRRTPHSNDANSLHKSTMTDFLLKHADSLWLISILLIAFVVRAWDFGFIPGGINQDEAMGAVDAKALADYGTDRYGMRYPVHFTAWTYGQMSVLLSYLMIPFIKIGGLTEITTRLPILIVSLCGLLALYGFIKNSFDRTTGLVVLFLAAINPWHIMQSRWALDCNGFPHFFMIGCYFLGIAHKRNLYLHLSMISFALCLYSYGVAFVVVPIFLPILAAYGLVRKLFSVKQIIGGAATYLLFSWPISMVMIINFLRIPTISTPLFTIPFFEGSVRSQDILFFSPDVWGQIKINIDCFMKAVLQHPDLLWNATDDYGTFYLFSLPLVILGLSITFKKAFQRENNSADGNTKPPMHLSYIIIILGLLVCIWTGIVIATVNVNRINIIYYFFILLAGVGLAQVLKQFKPLFIHLVSIYSLFFCLFCHHFFVVWPQQIGPVFFVGLGQALSDAAKIDTPRYYISRSNSYSEILTMFHHQIDSKYYLGERFMATHKMPSSATVAGNKYESTYNERYVFFDPNTHHVDINEPAVYVIENYEKPLFNLSNYEITDYRDFSLLVPKNLRARQ